MTGDARTMTFAAAAQHEEPALDDRLYHQDRARAELDMAYRAAGSAAAGAHLHLASLHLRRFEALRAPEGRRPTGERR
jgi:hypothetical protein